ncbi:TPA: xylulose kinase [Candidatus Poribacteria bacterium]|nr:xylulose kinase [Candidatus Poribacteria bacterium]HIB85793.1 xylulose kinase [Candidatus Poribacteria bacterium]HIB99987.1 xylulose kinase [Candidatus Poribacteria bacterium]HIN30073.1 xylulose kinase [Candidatus Poribacteria bacterium]HIO08663.1 xylulose kinase [Candidatus Poribacteria bacterium]
MAKLSLGLDASTQSLSAIIVDIESGDKSFEHSLDYRRDNRLNDFGIRSDYIIPPRVEGEADQPPEMFWAALDAMLDDIRTAGISLANVVVINDSGQQHGHVYLNKSAEDLFPQLRQKGSGEKDLLSLLEGSLAYLSSPIWMTSNTVAQTEYVRAAVGGKGNMIRLSGSDAPLRFTGTVIRRVAEQFPEVYTATENVQLISSLIPAILTGNSKVPIDYGNACGMSLMDYRNREWSVELVEATAQGLPGGFEAFSEKLPDLVSPDTIVGNIALYFVEKYGFSPSCKIVAGSGDNPQAKVLVSGDLLSLGTSFVNMVSTDGETFDMEGLANGMYDGIGRPFMFGCRTNGAMVWDEIRALYNLSKEDYDPAEEALRRINPGSSLLFWQPKNESFPPSGSFDLIRITYHSEPTLESDYAGIIDSSLAAVYVHSEAFTKTGQESLYVTGGATISSEIMRRIAAIWNRKVVSIETGGPALGAAVAGAYAACESEDLPFDVEQFSQKVLKRDKPIEPNPAEVAAYHNRGGYLEQFRIEEAKIIAQHPIE